MNDVDRLLATLSQNFSAYGQLEESLEREHRGEYAVLHDGALIGAPSCTTVR